MKVIFLDVDGVLVNRSSFREEARKQRAPGDALTPFDPACVARLNRITSSTGAQIVLSSVWRIGMRLIEAREFFLLRGVKEPIMDFTPRLTVPHPQPGDPNSTRSADRGAEIQKWLDEVCEDPEAFVILDDDSDMLHLMPRLVKTAFEYGLTDYDADRAIEMLCEVKA